MSARRMSAPMIWLREKRIRLTRNLVDSVYYINVRLEVGIAHRLEIGIKRLAAIVEPAGDAHL